MKREDLKQFLETAKPKIENAIAQSIKSGDGVVALHVQFTLCYSPSDDLANPLDAVDQMAEVVDRVFGELDTLAFEKGYLPQSCMEDGSSHEDDHADIGSPSSFEAFVINPEDDTILVEITPTHKEDRHVGVQLLHGPKYVSSTEERH